MLSPTAIEIAAERRVDFVYGICVHLAQYPC
jgi:hypothetical protein